MRGKSEIFEFSLFQRVLILFFFRNKIKIVDAGALQPLISFLQSPTEQLKEYAIAAVLTLTASPVNRPCIGASGAIAHLVKTLTLETASPQTTQDAITALSNLSTTPDNLRAILACNPVPVILSLLQRFQKSSKTAEKSTALLQSLLPLPRSRNFTHKNRRRGFGGGGSSRGRKQKRKGSTPVGALLVLCESNRDEYREEPF